MKEYHTVTIALVIALAVTISADNNLEIPVECPAVDLPEDVHLKHETDNTKFYLCQQGQKVLMDCPYRNKLGDRMHFNPQLQTCEWSDIRVLKKKPHPKNKNCPHENKCERNPDKKDKKNCRRFYQCDHGKEHKMECRKGLRFNPKTQMCDFPRFVKCGDRPPDCTKKTHHCSCHWYYEVCKDKTILRECPEDLFFDEEKQECVDPEETDCIKRPSDLLKLDMACPVNNVTSIITFSHESSCTLYHECNQGKIYLKMCPDAMHFDSIQGICEPAIAKCEKYCKKEEDDGEKGSPVPGEDDDDDELYFTQFKCSANENNMKSAHENSCSLYYMCQNGRKVIRTCPEGMHFNAVTLMCDLRKNAGCMVHPESQNHDVTEKIENIIQMPIVFCIGECPLTDPTDHTVLLPTNDCSKFCKCSNGVSFVESCPKGLHYDKKIQTCNWPYLAKCAKNNVMEYLVKTN